jgi:YD repeat-containing protein
MKVKLISFFVTILFLISASIPFPFCNTFGTPSFWNSRYYTMGLIDEGSTAAGLKGRSYEYAHLPTSKWTEMVADLQSGNHMLRAELFNLPGTPLPLSLQLTYNSANANVDIGVGKGWMTSLHAVVSEDAGTHDLTYVDATGAKVVFTWDAGNNKYINPSGFAGKAEELQAGGYKISPLESGSIIFNADGKLTEIAERCGTGKQTVSYDASGRPETLTDYLSGREINLTWSGAGKLTAVTDPMNHEWGITIDGSSHLTELVKPGGTTIKTTFTYDSTTHKMLSQTDFESNVYSVAYYTTGTYTGRLQTWTQPASANVTTDFAYDTAAGYSQKTTVTDGEDHAINYFFGSSSYALEKVVLGASGPEKEFVYNAAGFVTTAKDGYDKETTYAYDAVYHITSITNPPPTVNGVSFVREFTYDYATLDGKLVQSRDKVTTNPVTWAITSYEYTDQDAPCKPSSITNPIGEETTIAYDSNGMMTDITQPTNPTRNPPVTIKTTTYTSNSTTKTTTRITDTEGNDIAYTYNNNGLPTYVAEYEGSYSTGTLLHYREYTYNTVNLVTDTFDANTDKTTESVYNLNGAITSHTSEQGCSSSKLPIYNTEPTLPFDPRKPADEVAVAILNPGPVSCKGIDDAIMPVMPILPGNFLPLSITPYNPNPGSTTDTQGHTTSYTYRNDGTLHESTDYLSDVTDYSQDSYGRVDTITQSNGRTNTYSYNSNSKVTLIESDSEGSTSFTYDDAGQITQKITPVQGTVNYTYNVAGYKLTDEQGTYSYDLLGRKTGISYTAGGSDTWTYDVDGKISASTGSAFDYDQLGNITRWQSETNDYTTFSYTGSEGFTKLGLPSSTTGSTNLSSYSMAWDTNYWLQVLTPTGKTGSYSYSWSTTKEPTGITSPNSVNLSQTWTSKMLDAVTVSYNQTDYLVTDSTFNANEQMTQYVATVHESGQNTFTETNDITYDANGRISQLAYDSNNRTIDYGYDATTGLLESIDYSDLGEYVIAYSATTGNIDTVTYPNNAGTETYTYNGGLGRLSQIAFPSNKALNLTWNRKNQVTQVSYDDNGTTTSFALSYTITGKLSTYTKSVGGIQTDVWDFHYGPFGLEKADRTTMPTITQDFTTDPTGRILSMTYTELGGTANGEYYFHYDNFGNTTLLTDAAGNRQYAALYDLNNGKIVSVWNPNSLVLVNQGEGKNGGITIRLPDANNTPIVFTGEEFNKIDLTYHPISWGVATGGFQPDVTVGGGIKTTKDCLVCKAGEILYCKGTFECYYIPISPYLERYTKYEGKNPDPGKYCDAGYFYSIPGYNVSCILYECECHCLNAYY